MTFWRNVLTNILLQGQNAVLVVKKTPQNFYQCIGTIFQFSVRWILYHHIIKSTGMKTRKLSLCGLVLSQSENRTINGQTGVLRKGWFFQMYTH